MTPSRDTICAIVLLLLCGGLAWASLDIREPDYGQLSPATWPRIIVGVLAVLSVIYLAQSVIAGPDRPNPEAPRGPRAFLGYWRNVIWCFVLFGAYLVAIPWLGMLAAGIAFVFALLTALGGLRPAPLHAALAVIVVGGMWSFFTFGLNVILPRGEWTGF